MFPNPGLPGRLATACLALLLVPAALAQTPPPEAFYPLDVGNEWVYAYRTTGPLYLQHDRIVGEAMEGGESYAERERCVTPAGTNKPDCELHLVRLDADGDLVIRQPDGSEVAEACAVGAPDGTVTPCDDVVGEDFDLVVFQGGATTIVIGGQAVEVEAVQTYDAKAGGIDPPPAGFAVGIGRLAPLSFGGDTSRFEYARVRGREYGVHPLDPAPADFDPIAVGSVREFLVPGPDGPGQRIPQRADSPRALVEGGETWTLRRTQTLRPPDADGGRTRAERRALVRFDTASAQVVVRGLDGGSYPAYPCAFDAPPGQSECSAGSVTRSDGVSVGTPFVDARTTSVLSFDTLGGGFTFIAGIGLTWFQGDASPSGTELVFADLGPLPTGEPLPFGTPLDDLSTEIDPTPAHRYYPLSVGDEWHYQFTTVQSPEGYRRRRIIGTEVVDGETFMQDEFSTARPGDATPVWVVQRTDLVRYDSLTANVVTPFGPEGRFECPLDEPVNTDPEAPVFCGRLFEGEPADIAAFRTTPGTVVQQGGLVVPTESYKQFRYLGGGVDFETSGGLAAGVGLVYDPGTATTYAALEYARVRQDDGSVLTLGTPLPVDAEDDVPTVALALATSPNPTAGALRLTVEMPAAGTLLVEAFDALGRRVWNEAVEAAPGTTDLRLDAGAWAPGAYVVRVRAGDLVASARVVRR